MFLNLRDAWHYGIQGMSRSGKSVLVYGVLAQVAAMPEVVVAGLDPTGVLLGPWTAAPGRDWRATGTGDIPAAAAAVGRIVAEMDRRIASLPDRDLDKLTRFTPAEPILLTVLEEYPGLLAAAEADDEAEGRRSAGRLAPRIRRDVRRLIQEGAKVGVRVVMLAQRMDASIVGGAERSNIGTRVTLRVDNGDAVRMLHPSAPPELVDVMGLARPGQGVVDLPGEPLRRFKADVIDYGGYLARVRAVYPPRRDMQCRTEDEGERP